MGMDEAERAYRTQTQFHQMTDFMFAMLAKGDISVYELRDACTLAINMFGMRFGVPRIVVDLEASHDQNKATPAETKQTCGSQE